MPKTSHASVWRSLAIALGDGIAFGVGMKLAQGQARAREQAAAGEPARSEPLEPPAAREAAPGPPRSPEVLDLQVLDKVITALGARLAEHMGQVERRLADIEAKVAVELREIRHAARTATVAADDPQIEALRTVMEGAGRRHAEQTAAMERTIRAEVRAAEERMAALASAKEPEELTGRVDAVEAGLSRQAGEVDRNLAALKAGLTGQLAQRAGVLEQALRAEIHAVEDRLAALLSIIKPEELTGRVEAVEAGLAKQASTVADLRQRAESGERVALHLIAGIGKLCEETVRKIGPQPPAAGETGTAESTPLPDTPSGSPPAVLCANGAAAGREAAERAGELFTHREPGRVWPIPLASSSVVAALALVWLI
jgi:hypothetical protein